MSAHVTNFSEVAKERIARVKETCGEEIAAQVIDKAQDIRNKKSYVPWIIGLDVDAAVATLGPEMWDKYQGAMP